MGDWMKKSIRTAFASVALLPATLGMNGPARAAPVQTAVSVNASATDEAAVRGLTWEYGFQNMQTEVTPDKLLDTVGEFADHHKLFLGLSSDSVSPGGAA